MKKIILLLLLLLNISITYNSSECSFSVGSTALLADEFSDMINNPQALANWCGCTVTVTTGGSSTSTGPGYFSNGNYSGGAMTSTATGIAYGDGSTGSGTTTTTYGPQNPSTPSCYTCSCDAFFCPGGNPANTPPTGGGSTGDGYIDNDYPNYSGGGSTGGSSSGSSGSGSTGGSTGGSNNGEMGSSGAVHNANQNISGNSEFSSSNVWSSNLVILAVVQSPTITDVTTYLKCFNKSAGATFSIYVDQPTANSRDTWSGSVLDPNVGHTFISITQGGITRVLGFYPSTGVNPMSSTPASPSELINDGGHAYDVKVEKSITAAQLTSLLAAITAYNSTYNLNSYNCTDFAISMSSTAGLSLTDTSGTWPGGGGSNPGDLGEDIRAMSSGSGATVTKTSGTSASNSGTCP